MGASLSRHGFERIYWLNGHGGNVNTINAAFAEIYHGVSFDRAGTNHPRLRCTLRNWWELSGVMDLCRQLFPVGEGHHATPSEVSVTYFAYPEAISVWRCRRKSRRMGPILDAEDYRRRFPDGRIGSDPSQANVEAGEKIVAAAVQGGDRGISAIRKFLAKTCHGPRMRGHPVGFCTFFVMSPGWPAVAGHDKLIWLSTIPGALLGAEIAILRVPLNLIRLEPA